MADGMQRIAVALEDLKAKGIPESVLMAYLRQRTKLPMKQIQAVLDGLKELGREMRPTR